MNSVLIFSLLNKSSTVTYKTFTFVLVDSIVEGFGGMAFVTLNVEMLLKSF